MTLQQTIVELNCTVLGRKHLWLSRSLSIGCMTRASQDALETEQSRNYSNGKGRAVNENCRNYVCAYDETSRDVRRECISKNRRLNCLHSFIHSVSQSAGQSFSHPVIQLFSHSVMN